jgi:hypothetical protein
MIMKISVQLSDCDTPSVTIIATVSLEYPQLVSIVLCWNMNMVQFEIQIQILRLFSNQVIGLMYGNSIF